MKTAALVEERGKRSQDLQLFKSLSSVKSAQYSNSVVATRMDSSGSRACSDVKKQRWFQYLKSVVSGQLEAIFSKSLLRHERYKTTSIAEERGNSFE